MFSKKISIEFIAPDKNLLEILNKPYPATHKLPDWFGKMERYVDGVQSIDRYNDPTSTIKKCMPVFDMLGAGYHIPLHSDVWLENNGEQNLSFRWALDSMKIISLQSPEQHFGYPKITGYYNSVFKWINPWVIKTPPGWSCLFVHPQHHENLPFRSFSALVDTDKHPAPINFPFVVREGFDGLIAKDTPIIQVIPFKRENFISSFKYDCNNKLKLLWQKAHSVFFERYQRFFWTPKKYEQGKETKTSKCPFGF